MVAAIGACLLESFPPWGSISSEVGFGPVGEADRVVFADFNVGKGETERCWTSDDFAGAIILGSVTWAHVFVGSSVPGNNTTQMSADCVQSIVLKAIFRYN